MKTRILKNIEGIKVLHNDNVPCECPFKTSAPAQNNLGSITFITQPCTSKCVMFEMNEELESSGGIARDDKKTGRYRVRLLCTSNAEFIAEIQETTSTLKLH
jgi:hypothetical protein